MSIATRSISNPSAVVVWLDRWHAFIARRKEDGRRSIVEVGRDADTEPTYLRRIAEIARDCPRVMILGPDEDLEAFDRTYESLYERPDRFVDREACAWPTSAGLIDRLRLLEGEGIEANGPDADDVPEPDFEDELDDGRGRDSVDADEDDADDGTGYLWRRAGRVPVEDDPGDIDNELVSPDDLGYPDGDDVEEAAEPAWSR